MRRLLGSVVLLGALSLVACSAGSTTSTGAPVEPVDPGPTVGTTTVELDALTVATILRSVTADEAGATSAERIVDGGDDSGAPDRAGFLIEDAGLTPDRPYTLAVTVDIFATPEQAVAYRELKAGQKAPRSGDYSSCGRVYVGIGTGPSGTQTVIDEYGQRYRGALEAGYGPCSRSSSGT